MPPKTLPEELALALADFQEALRVEAGLSRNTLAAYRSDLNAFLAFVAGRGARRCGSIKPAHVVDWLAERREAVKLEVAKKELEHCTFQLEPGGHAEHEARLCH